jgi:TPP-dependent indolepyruvate ferredoxin oxidoreductase alpha subunit
MKIEDITYFTRSLKEPELIYIHTKENTIGVLAKGFTYDYVIKEFEKLNIELVVDEYIIDRVQNNIDAQYVKCKQETYINPNQIEEVVPSYNNAYRVGQMYCYVKFLTYTNKLFMHMYYELFLTLYPNISKRVYSKI